MARVWLMWAWAGLVVTAAGAGPVFHSVEPWRAVAGSEVTVRGGGLSSGLNFSLGGVPATVVAESETEVTLMLGGASESDELRWAESGGVAQSTGLAIEVIRSIAGNFAPPAAVTAAGYRLGWSPRAAEVAGAGAFSAEVAVGRPVLLWGVREPEDPLFLAWALPGDSTVTVDATSTAVALLTWMGPLATKDPAQLAVVRSHLLGMAEAQALAAAWAQGAGDGLDPLDDPRVEAAFTLALQAAMAALLPPSEDGGPTGAAPPVQAFGAATDHEIFVLTPGGASGTGQTPARLSFTLMPTSDAAPEHRVLRVEAPGRSSVDWMLELIRLFPDAYPDGHATVAALQPTSSLPGRESQPLATGFVRAKLIGQKFDLVERAMNALVDSFAGAVGIDDGLQSGDFPIPVAAPGLYAVNAYSGNLYYGSTWSGGLSQAPVLVTLDYDNRHVAAAASNIVIAAVDTVSVAIDISDLVPPPLISKVSVQVAHDTQKALQSYRDAGKEWDTRMAADLFKTSMAAVAKVVTTEGLKGGAEAVAVRFSKTLAKNAVRVIDYYGRAVSAAQAAERLYGLASADVFAVERAVILVGDPFAPRIRSFYPLSGRRGTVIQIHGSNFPENPSNVQVTLCNFGTGAPPPITGELELEVLGSSSGAILARVPEGWEAVFGSERHAYVCVRRRDDPERGFTTLGLPDPFVRFRYTGLPELESIDPNPAVAGGIAVLQGTGFDVEGRAKVELLIDGEVIFGGVTSAASDTRMAVSLPSHLTGERTLALRVNGVVTNTIPLTIERQSTSQHERRGLTITITKADFSNSPDGEISILEAFLLTRGELGRPIEIHPPSDYDPGPWQRREIDHVQGADEFGLGGGLQLVDFVLVANELWAGTPQAVAAPAGLPQPGPGDSYDLLGLIFDGGGAAVSGWDLNGVGEFYARVHLRNYGGHGIHLHGGSRRVRLQPTIENVGGHGIWLDGDVAESQFLATMISGTGDDALRLSGAGVRYNALRLPGVFTPSVLGQLERSGGYGLRIEDGASFNQVHPGTVRHNPAGGIIVTGPDTQHNVIGRNTPEVPRSSDVVRNGGHGVLITDGAKYTLVRYLMAAGNEGDGFRIEGPGAVFNEIASCGTGLDFYPEGTVTPDRALRNTGAGIRVAGGASDNRIGGREPGSFGWRGGIGNNDESGVIIEGEGTDRTIISRLNVGDARALVEAGGNFANPNGLHGIHVRGGAQGTIIGDTHSFLDVHVLGAPNGAAILIEGEGTDGTLVMGNQIGTDHGNNFLRPGEEIREGIVIRDGPRASWIGLPGALMFDPDSFQPYRPFNVIGNAMEAGIRIEHAGGEYDGTGRLAGANTLMNNRVGLGDSSEDAGNWVGIVFGPGSQRNILGGHRDTEANDIINNTHAGIHFSGLVAAHPRDRVRVQRNRVNRTGVTAKAPPITDPALGPPAGVGILVDGGSSGFTIGEDWNWPIDAEDNRVGVYLDDVSGVGIRSTSIRLTRAVGVAVRGGGDNRIGDGAGGGLEIVTLRTGGTVPKAGILLVGTTGNRVAGNLVGMWRGGAAGNNNAPGIVLQDAAGNLIGGPTLAHGNITVNSLDAGILIKGPGSTGNVLAQNRVGVDHGEWPRPNNGAGIRLEGGASDNHVGGVHVMDRSGTSGPRLATNIISRNTGPGIAVDGAGTVGNRILDNVITRNTGAGIFLSNGGNSMQVAPQAATVDENRVSGTILDLLAIPVGARIQAFTDPDSLEPEGAAYLGEATVQPGGTWSINGLHPIVYPNFSLTATHPDTGDTSPFGFGAEWLLGLEVERSDGGVPGSRTVSFGPGPLPVHAVKLTARGVDVRVTELRLRSTGSLDTTADLVEVRLYRDRDRDGQIGAGDELIAGGGRFDGENGELVWELDDVLLPAGLPVHWLVAYLAEPSATPPAGTTMEVRIETAESATAQVGLPFSAAALVPVLGTFPVVSDLLTLGETASLIEAWLTLHFSAGERLNPAVSGLLADPDGDGLPNLLEYALGRNPRLRDAGPVMESFAADGRWHFAYTRRAPPREVAFAERFSHDLALWNAYGTIVESVEIIPLDDGLERVVLRTHLVPAAPTPPAAFGQVEVERL